MYDKKTISHLVLSGGGGSGFIYLGALRYLQQENYLEHIKHISGTSIGSLFGAIFALNISMGDFEIFLKEKLKTLKKNNINFIELIDNFGLIDKENNFLFKIIKEFFEKYNYNTYTFLDLAKNKGINILIQTLHFSTLKEFVFNIDTTPNVLLLDAIYASMSLPFIFKPYKIGNELYIDGGVTNNIPIKSFYNINNENILIIQCHRDHSNNLYENNNIINYLLNIMNLVNTEVGLKNLLKLKYKYYITFKDIPIAVIPYKIDENFILSTTITEELLEQSVIQGYEQIYNYITGMKPLT